MTMEEGKKVDTDNIKIDRNRVSSLSRPETSLELSCHSLSYMVSVKKDKKAKDSSKQKTLLFGINAVFRPGRMTAVMGASGAGKTTLLNLLSGVSGSAKESTLQGRIKINGQTANEHGIKMKNICGYVHQDDVLFDTMTVREALEMSATLRLPSAADRSSRVQDLITTLGLESCESTRIGNSLNKGISGGERKRTAISMEMITNPSILFLDEPTSGLDTFTAHNVVSNLRELAHVQGRTVIATIHQPSSEIFYLFDDLLLLADGKVLYHGSVAGVVEYFARNGYICPQYCNPADYVFMDILNSQNDDSSDRILKMLTAWEKSPENLKLLEELDGQCAGSIPATAVKIKTSFFTQTGYLFKRALRNALRNKMVVQVKVFQSVFIGLLVGCIYYNLPEKGFQAQIQDRIGALFFIVLNQFMSSSMGVLHAFSQERPVFLREYSQGYYTVLAYYLTKIGVEIPFQVVAPLFTIVICYFMIGFQRDFGKFCILAADAMLTSLCGMGLGIVAGAAFPHIGIALAVVPMLILPLMLFSGLYVNTGSIPGWLKWIKNISPPFYAFNAAAKNEFTGLLIQNCPSPLPSPCSGEIALEQLSMTGGPSIIESFLILGGIYAIMLVASFSALWLLTRHQKSK